MVTLKAKPTLASLKSFIRKNRNDLLLKVTSSYSCMIDGCEYYKEATFTPVQNTDRDAKYTLGISGVWWVANGSRNYITPFDNGEYLGYEVSNCCGNFTLAVKKGN